MDDVSWLGNSRPLGSQPRGHALVFALSEVIRFGRDLFVMKLDAQETLAGRFWLWLA